MASWGMIGIASGIGQGLQQQAKFLERQEEEERADTRQRSFQDWLMKKREEYAVASEGRQEARQIASEERGESRKIAEESRTETRRENEKDRDFDRTQREAGERRTIKVEDEKASARGKSEVAAETLETDARVKGTLAEAGQTQADKDLKGAQAEYYKDRGDAAGNKPGKLDPADDAQLKSVQAESKRLADLIDKSKIEGNWQGTPEQKQAEARLVVLRKQEQAILGKYRSAGGGAAAKTGPVPELNNRPQMKVPPATQAARDAEAGSLMLKNEYGGDVSRLRADIDKAKQELARTTGDARGILQGHITRMEAALAGGAAPPAPLATAKVTPPAAAPAAPPKPAGPQPGTAQAALQELTGMDQSKVQAVDDEIQRAGASRRPPTFSDEMKPVAERVMALRSRIVQEDVTARKVDTERERRRQEEANQRIRDQYRDRR